MPLLRLFCLVLAFALPATTTADVVKPALIEISAHNNGKVVIDIRVSLEALLTGINAQYQNTQDAPTAEEYDEYRVLSSEDLRIAFKAFEPKLLQSVWLTVDDKPIELVIDNISIPEPGYTKVPRISTVLLEGRIPINASQLQWYYPSAFGDNAVRVRQVDSFKERWHWSQWQWLRADKPSEQFSLDELFSRRPAIETISSYIVVGFAHILPLGMDHILFIIGLFLLSTRFKPLLWQVTMFTLAHTITLGLSMNGIIELPARVVEPLIALSIAYIGVENVMHRKVHNSRLALIFAFGLLHGLGFASVLKDFGMPEEDFLVALISFNVGVELGQIAILCIAWVSMFLFQQRPDFYRRLVVVPISLTIMAVGLLWTVERIVA